jgi:hypothetical protein
MAQNSAPSPLGDPVPLTDPFDDLIASADDTSPLHSEQRLLLDMTPLPRAVVIKHSLSDADVDDLFLVLFMQCARVPNICSVVKVPFHPDALFIEGLAKDDAQALIDTVPALSAAACDVSECDRAAIVAHFCNPSRGLALLAGHFVRLTAPSCCGDAAQVLQTDLVNRRVVVRTFGHIDYDGMRHLGCTCQSELNARMDHNYQAPARPFERKILPRGAIIGDVVVSCKYAGKKINLRGHTWDGRTFCGPFEILDLAIADVRVNVRLTEDEEHKFIGFRQFLLGSAGAKRRSWPEPRIVKEMPLVSESGLAVGDVAMIADGAHKDRIVYVNKIDNDGTVEATMMAFEITGKPTAFKYVKTGCYSVEVPEQIVPVEIEFPVGTIVRTYDYVGVVMVHADDDLQIVTFENEKKWIRRGEVIGRVPEANNCVDHDGWRVCVGDEVSFHCERGKGFGVIVHSFDGKIMVRPADNEESTDFWTMQSKQAHLDNRLPGFAPASPQPQLPYARVNQPQ